VTTQHGLRRYTPVLFLTALVVGATVHPAVAQERPAPAAEFAAGALFFPDEGVVTEPFVGGNVRFYVSPRVSIGPEFAYVSGDRHSHLMLTGNVTVDLTAPRPAATVRVVPFVVAGGGLFTTNESFPSDPSFTSTEGAFTAGGGVRADLGLRVFAGVEARVGWETHVRINGMIGFRLN
jgi:hypothetical protein